MRNEEDYRWLARWPGIKVEKGTEEVILNANSGKLLQVLNAMNMLHMNDATRAMLRDKYPSVYKRLLEAQYSEAEQRLVTLLRQ